MVLASSLGSQQYIKHGSTVELQCAVPDTSNAFNLTSLVGPNGTYYVIGGDINADLPSTIYSRLGIQKDNSGYKLYLEDFKREDQGVYKCQRYPGEETNDTFSLYLLEPPTAIIINQNINTERINGIEGRDLDLNCTAVEGQPEPEVWWFHQNEILTRDMGTALSTLPRISRDKDLTMISCLAKNEALDKPMVRDMQIVLALRPSRPSFDRQKIVSEVGLPLKVSCYTSGGRPSPVLKWTLAGSDVTGYSKVAVVGDLNSATDTFTVTSTLEMKVNQSYDGTTVTCSVTHDVTFTYYQTSQEIIVKFPPAVNLGHNITTSVAFGNITLECNASGGNPASYSYRWTHYSFYNEKIRELTGDDSGMLRLPLVGWALHLSYIDSGIYLCSVTNGIKDEKGQMYQNTTSSVHVETYPIFVDDSNDDSIQYGQLGQTVTLSRSVHCLPNINTTKWYILVEETMLVTSHKQRRRKRYQKQIFRSMKHELTEGERHSMSVRVTTFAVPDLNFTIDVYELALTIHDVRLEDFASYTVKIGNKYGYNHRTIHLKPSAVPETPNDLVCLVTTFTSCTLVWSSNFDGGHQQRFVVDYRVNGTTPWNRVAVSESSMKLKENEIMFVLLDLHPSSIYEIRVVAINSKGESPPSQSIVITTLDEPYQDRRNYGVMIGGALGGILIAVVMIGITTIFLRTRSGKHQKSRDNKGATVTWKKDTVCDISSMQNDFVISIGNLEQSKKTV